VELPPALGRRIDEVCNRFEAAWRSGMGPLLEDFLAGWEGAERAALLRELVPLDAEYRRGAGEPCAPADYLARFPDVDATALAEAVPRFPEVPGYEVLKELGRGGRGVVYLASDPALKRLVAIKMILAGRTASAADRARLRAEAEAAARVRHPHVIEVYSSGEYDGCPYFVCEYAPGGSLAKRVGDQPQPPRDAARLVMLLARAAHAAHRERIVHRDLKPSNVLLAPPADEAALNTPYGLPKVADFGLAKYLDGRLGQTGSNDILGTVQYMAPEQAEGKPNEVGPAADVYALGAILYQLLTGRPPIQGTSTLDTLRRICADPVRPPGEVRPDVPEALGAICLHCLAKAPADRYPTALALAEDLRRFLEGEALPPTTPVPVRAPSRQRLAVAAGALLGAVTLVAVGMAFRPSGSGPPSAGPPATAPSGSPSAGGSEAAPLKGWVDVRVWKAGATERPGLRLHQNGALPLRAGDYLRMEADLNRPAYLYVIQLVSSGEAVPLYPWRNYDWRERAPEKARRQWSLPEAAGTGAPLDPSPSGVESILLLTREEPLPAGEDAALAALFADLPKQQPPADARLAAWFENGALVAEEGRGPIRLEDAREVGDMVMRTQALLRDKLRPLFPYTRAVCYGFEGP
jgi:serine/threonine protein kinase